MGRASIIPTSHLGGRRLLAAKRAWEEADEEEEVDVFENDEEHDNPAQNQAEDEVLHHADEPIDFVNPYADTPAPLASITSVSNQASHPTSSSASSKRRRIQDTRKQAKDSIQDLMKERAAREKEKEARMRESLENEPEAEVVVTKKQKQKQVIGDDGDDGIDSSPLRNRDRNDEVPEWKKRLKRKVTTEKTGTSSNPARVKADKPSRSKGKATSTTGGRLR